MILPIPPDILRRARTGDAEAFEALLRMYERQVLGVAVRLTGNLQDGQDVAQEVFIKLHRELQRFSSMDQIGPWLYRVTANACFDLRRRAKRSPLESIGLGWATWRTNERSPEQRMTEEQDKDVLGAAMQTLSDRERAALTLRELEGLSTAEVAATLGSAESTVRVQIAAARVKLRKFLKGRAL